MKTRNLLASLGIAAALAAGLGAYSYTASAQDGSGYGPGMMGDYGQGYGRMGGYGPGMMGGYRQMGGWGRGGEPGTGWNCPGFAQGNGPGYGATQSGQTLNLTTDDVRNRMERWLAWRGNPRLQIGEVKEKDADTITADIVTKDNSLVERFVVDRHTGAIRLDNS